MISPDLSYLKVMDGMLFCVIEWYMLSLFNY